LKTTVKGHGINIEYAGPDRGACVVLLHHGLGSVRAWKGQVPALVDAGYKVVMYDRWGYGNSDTRPELDLPSFASDLQDLDCLLEQSGIQKAAFIGHSDGGTIALYFAAQQPAKVSCLVTVAAHIYAEAKMEPGILDIKKSYEADERFRMGMRYAHGEKHDQVFYNWFTGWHRPEILTWDMRPWLSQIHCPALIVQGEKDEHATPQHAMDLASSIPGAELWLMPGAKHMLPQVNVAEFNSKILQFLKDHLTDEM
jgi:pimeloyl-ACP methyl ester carboxylesterase